MIPLKSYSIVLSIAIAFIIGIVEVILHEGFSIHTLFEALLEAAILLIVIIPLIYFLTGQTVKEIEQRVIKEGEKIMKLSIENERLNEELKSSKNFLNSVLEGIGEGVIVIDRNFRIIAANNAYINQEQYEEGVIGEHCYKISHHSEKACHKLGYDCPVLKTFETGESASGVHTHYDSEGKAFYVEVHSCPLEDSSGNVTMVVETITDVTERYRLEKDLMESERRYRDLYDNAPDMYCSINVKGIIIECNNTIAETLGYKTEELIGKPFTLLCASITCEDLNKKIEELKKTRSLYNIEVQLKTKDSRQLDTLLNMTATYNESGSYIYAMVSARDITEKKKVETELKKKMKDLEDFYNMAIDREMKMIELKKEIERLREQKG